MITHYLNIDLFKELGLDGLPEERKQALADKMMQVIEGRVLGEVQAYLSDEKWEELQDLLDSDSQAALQFVQTNVPNYDILVKEKIAEYKAETLELYNRVNAINS